MTAYGDTKYRRQRQELAARSALIPALFDLLSDTRRRLREWRRSIVALKSEHMRLTTNGQGTSASHVAMLEQIIAQNRALLARFDPDGVTEDGNIEMGELTAHEYAQILAGRWATVTLDEHGQAVSLQLYDARSAAQADAQAHGRAFGHIADDAWSIEASATESGSGAA